MASDNHLEEVEEGRNNSEIKRLKALIVDDNEVNLKVLELRLKKKNFETVVTSDPKKAIEIIDSHSFDIVLLDMIMPEVSGLDILDVIRSKYSAIEVPVIMTTAQLESSNIVKALENGANDYITKPIDFNVAWARISTHITIKKLNEDLEKKRLDAIGHARMGTLVDMAGSVAHEINNPLTIILGWVQLLMNSIKNDGPKEKLLLGLDNIFQSVLRVEGVVKGLSAFAKEGRDEEVSNLSIKNVLQTTLSICQTTLNDMGILFKAHDLKEDVVIRGREGMFIQVFFNLIKNSIEAIKDSQEKWIEIKYEVKEKELKIFFTDSGVGISKGLREKIMLPFFTTHEMEQGSSSMGLGLSICRGIIEEHEGSFELNPESENTQFIIHLGIRS
jgi:C4-dicarboxylate-specific signal transduction histidine kinase